MPDLIAQLLRAPQQFNLFQAIHLLERAAPERAPVGTGVGMDEAVRLAAQVDMAFAPSDVTSINANPQRGPTWILRTPALTLAGGQGPLAAPYTELLLEQRSARNFAGLDFLDIFNQRLIGLWHRARAKHHVALQPGGTSPVPAPGQAPMAPLLRTIDHLSGLGRGQSAHGPVGELAWLRHAGLQSGAPRSMASLLALLRDRFAVQFCGEQFIGGWHALAPSERACLHGAATRPRGQRGVRMGTSLGARAWDQAAGMALSAPPLPAAQFAALLPGSTGCALLGWLVARHLQAECTVMLTLTLAEAPTTMLGAITPLAPRLGRSAWLSSRAGVAQRYRPARFVLSAPTVNLTKAA